jgi:hypothetical protein
VAVSVEDVDEGLEIAAGHGFYPLRGVGTYEDVFELIHVRGPSDMLLVLTEELTKRRAPSSVLVGRRTAAGGSLWQCSRQRAAHEHRTAWKPPLAPLRRPQ